MPFLYISSTAVISPFIVHRSERYGVPDEDYCFRILVDLDWIKQHTATGSQVNRSPAIGRRLKWMAGTRPHPHKDRLWIKRLQPFYTDMSDPDFRVGAADVHFIPERRCGQQWSYRVYLLQSFALFWGRGVVADIDAGD